MPSIEYALPDEPYRSPNVAGPSTDFLGLTQKTRAQKLQALLASLPVSGGLQNLLSLGSVTPPPPPPPPPQMAAPAMSDSSDTSDASSLDNTLARLLPPPPLSLPARQYATLTPPTRGDDGPVPTRNAKQEAIFQLLAGVLGGAVGGANGFTAGVAGTRSGLDENAQNLQGQYANRARANDAMFKAAQAGFGDSVKAQAEQRAGDSASDKNAIEQYNAQRGAYNADRTDAEKQAAAKSDADQLAIINADNKAKAGTAFYASLANLTDDARQAAVKEADESGALTQMGLKIAKNADGTYDVPAGTMNAAIASQEQARQDAETQAADKQKHADLITKYNEAASLFKNPQTSKEGRDAAASTMFDIEKQLGVAGAKPLRSSMIADFTPQQNRIFSMQEKRYNLAVQEAASREKARQAAEARAARGGGRGSNPFGPGSDIAIAQRMAQLQGENSINDKAIENLRKGGQSLTDAQNAELSSRLQRKNTIHAEGELIRQSMGGRNPAGVFTAATVPPTRLQFGGRNVSNGNVGAVDGDSIQNAQSLPPAVSAALARTQGRGFDWNLEVPKNHTSDGKTTVYVHGVGVPNPQAPDRYSPTDEADVLKTITAYGASSAAWDASKGAYRVTYPARGKAAPLPPKKAPVTANASTSSKITGSVKTRDGRPLSYTVHP